MEGKYNCLPCLPSPSFSLSTWSHPVNPFIEPVMHLCFCALYWWIFVCAQASIRGFQAGHNRMLTPRSLSGSSSHRLYSAGSVCNHSNMMVRQLSVESHMCIYRIIWVHYCSSMIVRALFIGLDMTVSKYYLFYFILFIWTPSKDTSFFLIYF